MRKQVLRASPESPARQPGEIDFAAVATVLAVLVTVIAVALLRYQTRTTEGFEK